jgi:hypothetical protein
VAAVLAGSPMLKSPRVRLLLLLALLATSPVAAQQAGNEDSTYKDSILVTGEDVTTCPYHFIGPVYVSSGEDWMTGGAAADGQTL